MKKQASLLTALLFIPALFFAQGNLRKPVLRFTENRGQVKMKNPSDPQVLFVMKAEKLSYFFTDHGYSIVQHGENGDESRIDFTFPDQQQHIPEGVDRLLQNDRFYLAGQVMHVQSFKKIVYRDCAAHTSLEFSLDGNRIYKTLTGQDGFPPVNLEMECSGAVVTATPVDVPVSGISYRIGDNYIWEISKVFLAADTENASARSVNPGATQSNSTISWYTYVGGTSSDELFATVLMPDEGAVVTGRTGSTDFPSTVGSLQDTLAGSYDVVVMRFDSAGTCLWSTFYGGTNFETGYAIDRIGGRVIVAGSTNSTDLPMANAPQGANAGSYDAFILALDDSGAMVRATYYGGAAADQGFSVAEDTLGRIVLAGSSTGVGLPMSASGFQPAPAGAIDAFIAVFDTLLQPQWATYYGGSSSEDIHSVTVTPQGEIAFCGGTYSTNFPVTANAIQTGNAGSPDVYIVKFGMDGSRHYSTYLGGGNQEDANSIVADSTGHLYVAGFTYSTIDFPIQGNSFQSIPGPLSDAYVICLDSTGQIYWSTFLGGDGAETAFSVYRRGKYIFIGGNTESTDFPVSPNAIQPVYAGNSDGFVVKMDTAGNMVSGTYMGGNGVDAIYGLVVTPSDTSVIACADTYSTDLPVTPGAYQSTNNGAGDGYVVKFGMSEEPVMNAVAQAAAQQENGLLRIFPNPATDFVKLKTEGEIISRVELLDANGRLLRVQNFTATEAMIDVSGLSKGMYSLVIYSGKDERQVMKLLKK